MHGRSYVKADVNRTAVLAHLGANGPASRAELARMLDVSPALMTQLTKELILDGLVVELEHSPSQGGRPARMLGLASSAARAIGVKVAADHVAFVEVGIDGRLVRSAIEPFDASASTVLAQLGAQSRRFIESDSTAPILGMGVGVPGSVDRQGSGIVDSVQLGWNRVPLGETLRRELGLPVLVENNVNALAMAERLYGIGNAHDSFLVVTIGTGVGAAIVVDGVVLRGTTGAAGEIGHTPIAQTGPVCSCGNTGCLEAFLAEHALVAKARTDGAIPASAGMPELQRAADRGDGSALRVFEDAGSMLGRALAGAVHLLDPEIVIVLGEGTAAWSHWAKGFEPAFRGSLMPAKRGVGVAVETWQDESWAQGAAAIVLATPFDAEGVAGEQGRLVRERFVAQSTVAVRTS